MSSDLTLEVLQRIVPKRQGLKIDQDLVDSINTKVKDPLECEAFRDNLISYTTVLGEGRFKVDDYINAVQYVTHQLLGDSNIVAWTKTFPIRYQRILATTTGSTPVDSHVSMYNKNVLVNKVREQTLIPTHIINADLHQKAINHLAYLMLHATSERVQSDSAAKLVDALKIPETLKIELDIGLKEDDSIKELRQTTMELVKQQKLAIEAGARSVKEIAHSKIIREEIIDVEAIEE